MARVKQAGVMQLSGYQYLGQIMLTCTYSVDYNTSVLVYINDNVGLLLYNTCASNTTV